MKYFLFFFVTCAFLCFSACKSENSVAHDHKEEVKEPKSKSSQKIVTVSNTENVNVQIKESENVVASNVEDSADKKGNGMENESTSTPEELVQKAINTKPTAKVDNQPIQKVKNKAKKPVKKPKPNPVKSAPIEYLPKIKFDELSYDFGEITEGDIIKHNFTFTNVGKTKLSIEKATASCGCTKPSFPFIDIQPGETGYIGVTYHSVSKEGPQKPTITVFSNAHPNQMTLHLTGTVLPKTQEDANDTLEIMSQDTTKN